MNSIKFCLFILGAAAGMPNALADGDGPVLRAGGPPTQVPAKWELLNEKEGVKAYRHDIPGSPIVEFRGEGLVDAPLDKVASIVFDPVRSKEWVDDEIESRIDRWVNPFEWIEYDHMGTPFIIKDRDFVTHGQGRWNTDGYDIMFSYKSVEDPKLPLTRFVRGEIVRAITGLKSTGDKSVYIVMEAQVDPKGSVPLWLVNWVQKSWAVETMMALRKQAKKTDIQIDPFVQRILDQRKLHEKENH